MYRDSKGIGWVLGMIIIGAILFMALVAITGMADQATGGTMNIRMVPTSARR